MPQSKHAKDDKKFIQTAKTIINRNPEVFEALLEFERTHKLPKLRRKERVNFTIDSDLIRNFREYCQKNQKVMSKIIEKKILEELKLTKFKTI